MKCAVVAWVMVVALTGNALGADNWYDWLAGREPTHVWVLPDGSRTYRYDSGNRTYYEHRSAQSIQAEREFNAELTAVGILLAIDAAKAIYNWFNSPATQAAEDASIKELFGSEDAFIWAVNAELRRAVKQWEAFGASSDGVMIFGIDCANELMAFDDGKTYLVCKVSESTNPALKPGDVIVRCNGELLRPGRDLTTIMNTHRSKSGKYTLAVLRNGRMQEITAFARPVSFTALEIRERQSRDAVETVILKRLVEVRKVPVAWKYQ